MSRQRLYIQILSKNPLLLQKVFFYVSRRTYDYLTENVNIMHWCKYISLYCVSQFEKRDLKKNHLKYEKVK